MYELETLVGKREEFKNAIDEYQMKYPYLITEETLWEAYHHVAIEATMNVGLKTLMQNEILMRFKDRHLLNLY